MVIYYLYAYHYWFIIPVQSYKKMRTIVLEKKQSKIHTSSSIIRYFRSILKQRILVLLSLWSLSYIPILSPGQSIQDIVSTYNSNYFELRDELYELYMSKDSAFRSRNGFTDFIRWSLFWDERADSTGSFSSANQEILDFITDQSMIFESEDFTQAKWKLIGPVKNNYPQPMAKMGLVSDLWINPDDYNTILAASNSGGLFKTTDGGKYWKCLTDNLYGIGIESIAVNPQEHNQIFISTSFENGVFSNSYGLGTFKSVDGGLSWDTAGLNSLNIYQGISTRGGKMIMDPDHPDTLFILMHLPESTRIYRTYNATQSWQLVYETSDHEMLYDITFKPGNPEYLFASGTRLFISEDNGDSWYDITSRLNLEENLRIQNSKIAFNPENSESFILCTYLEEVTPEETFTYKLVFNTSNSGTSFHWMKFFKFDQNAFKEYNPNYSPWRLEIAYSKADTNYLYLGGIDFYKFKFSKDFDTVLELQNRWDSFHKDTRALLVYKDESNYDVIFNGNDSGATKAAGHDNNWTDITGEGLAITQFYGFGIHPQAPVILGGTQDGNDCIFYYEDSSWLYPGWGDAYDAIFNPDNPLVSYVVNYFNLKKYYDYNFKVQSNSTILSFADYNEPRHLKVPFTIDPQDTSILFIGLRNIYKSINSGSSWSKLTDFPVSGQNIDVPPDAQMRCLALAPTDPNVIYLSFKDPYWNDSSISSKFIKSEDGGINWIDLTTSITDLQWLAISDIVIHPENEDILWIGLNGIANRSRVLKSTDGGQN